MSHLAELVASAKAAINEASDVAALDNVRVKLARELEEDDQVMFVQNDPAAPYHNRLQRPGIYFMCQISGRN